MNNKRTELLLWKCHDFTSKYEFVMQGFLPVEALILEVEVWGFGGRTAKEVQTSYKRREELFTEQRRKVTYEDQIKTDVDACKS